MNELALTTTLAGIPLCCQSWILSDGHGTVIAEKRKYFGEYAVDKDLRLSSRHFEYIRMPGWDLRLPAGLVHHGLGIRDRLFVATIENFEFQRAILRNFDL